MRGRRDFIDTPERQCHLKVRHASKAVAKRAARRANTPTCRPYRCVWCGWWHLGNDRPKGWVA